MCLEGGGSYLIKTTDSTDFIVYSIVVLLFATDCSWDLDPFNPPIWKYKLILENSLVQH